MFVKQEAYNVDENYTKICVKKNDLLSFKEKEMNAHLFQNTN